MDELLTMSDYQAIAKGKRKDIVIDLTNEDSSSDDEEL